MISSKQASAGRGEDVGFSEAEKIETAFTRNRRNTEVFFFNSPRVSLNELNVVHGICQDDRLSWFINIIKSVGKRGRQLNSPLRYNQFFGKKAHDCEFNLSEIRPLLHRPGQFAPSGLVALSETSSSQRTSRLPRWEKSDSIVSNHIGRTFIPRCLYFSDGTRNEVALSSGIPFFDKGDFPKLTVKFAKTTRYRFEMTSGSAQLRYICQTHAGQYFNNMTRSLFRDSAKFSFLWILHVFSFFS